MTTVCPVKAPERLPAVTHEDGTARLQTVTAESAPFLHQVLAQTNAQGTACVLNTSLNGRREPICASSADAVAFLAAHPGVHALVVGDVLVERPA